MFQAKERKKYVLFLSWYFYIDRFLLFSLSRLSSIGRGNKSFLNIVRNSMQIFPLCDFMQLERWFIQVVGSEGIKSKKAIKITLKWGSNASKHLNALQCRLHLTFMLMMTCWGISFPRELWGKKGTGGRKKRFCSGKTEFKENSNQPLQKSQ